MCGLGDFFEYLEASRAPHRTDLQPLVVGVGGVDSHGASCFLVRLFFLFAVWLAICDDGLIERVNGCLVHGWLGLWLLVVEELAPATVRAVHLLVEALAQFSFVVLGHVGLLHEFLFAVGE